MLSTLSIVFLCSIPNAISDLLLRETSVFFNLLAGSIGFFLSVDPISKIFFALAILSSLFLPDGFRIGNSEVGGGDIDQLLLIAGTGMNNVISVVAVSLIVAVAYAALSKTERRSQDIPYVACLSAGLSIVVTAA